MNQLTMYIILELLYLRRSGRLIIAEVDCAVETFNGQQKQRIRHQRMSLPVYRVVAAAALRACGSSLAAAMQW